MTRDDIKSRLYNFTPKSWFTTSGFANIIFPEDATLKDTQETTCIQDFEWQTIRIFFEEAPESNVNLYFLINGQSVRNIVFPKKQTSLIYEFSQPLDIIEGDVLQILILDKELADTLSRFCIAFNNSTWECFLDAITDMGSYINDNIEQLQDDIFLNTSEGSRLDQWAHDLTELKRDIYDTDEIFRKKIITEILRPKQTRNAILDSINSILNEYYPPNENTDTTTVRVYSGTSGNSGSGQIFSGSGYQARITEPWYEDAWYVPLQDKGLPGRFYITIPVDLINESSIPIFNAIEKKVERIKAKGIKVICVKELITNLYSKEFYKNRISDLLTGTITFKPPKYVEKLDYTLTGVNADLNYISNYELERFSDFGGIVDVIDIKNNLTFTQIYSGDAHNEEFIFNHLAFYVGESALGKDQFVYIPYNYDRCRIKLINNINSLPDEYVFEDELT